MKIKKKLIRNLADLVFCMSLVAGVAVPGYLSNKEGYKNKKDEIVYKVEDFFYECDQTKEEVVKRVNYEIDIRTDKELMDYINKHYNYDYSNYEKYDYKKFNDFEKIDNLTYIFNTLNKYGYQYSPDIHDKNITALKKLSEQDRLLRDLNNENSTLAKFLKEYNYKIYSDIGTRISKISKEYSDDKRYDVLFVDELIEFYSPYSECQYNDYIHYSQFLAYDDLAKLSQDKYQFIRELDSELSKDEHNYRKGALYIKYNEDPKGLVYFNRFDLAKVYILHKNLQNQTFCNTVGAEIESDLRDPYGEHGGLIFMNNGYLDIKDYQNWYSTFMMPAFNKEYHPISSFYIDSPNSLVAYHLHACWEDCTLYSGPSEPDLLVSMGYCTDDIVITKLKGNRFNVDFYSSKGVIIDLGNYSYDNELYKKDGTIINNDWLHPVYPWTLTGMP